MAGSLLLTIAAALAVSALERSAGGGVIAVLD
jgi:hypothetical protein